MCTTGGDGDIECTAGGDEHKDLGYTSCLTATYGAISCKTVTFQVLFHRSNYYANAISKSCPQKASKTMYVHGMTVCDFNNITIHCTCMRL